MTAGGRVAVLAAALYLALVQLVSAGHAWSAEAMAPDHGGQSCAECILAGHGSAPPPDLAPAVAAPQPAFFSAAAPLEICTRAAVFPRKLSLRGPPTR